MELIPSPFVLYPASSPAEHYRKPGLPHTVKVYTNIIPIVDWCQEVIDPESGTNWWFQVTPDYVEMSFLDEAHSIMVKLMFPEHCVPISA